MGVSSPPKARGHLAAPAAANGPLGFSRAGRYNRPVLAPRACIWDYVSVMTRDPREPVDPRAWPLRARRLYGPLQLLHDVRSGQWGRASRAGRAVAIAGVITYVAWVGVLLAVIAVVLHMPLLFRLPDHKRAAATALIAVFAGVMAWPTAWFVWSAAGGMDRATAPLRRSRLRPARQGAVGAATIAARRKYWAREIATWPNRRFDRSRHCVDPAAPLLSGLPMVLVWTVLLVHGVNTVSNAVGGAVLIAYFTWDRRRSTALRRRLLDALERHACPDCAYPLPSGPEPPWSEPEEGWRGPARCPECGSRWPLVPPPIPGEEDCSSRAPT